MQQAFPYELMTSKSPKQCFNVVWYSHVYVFNIIDLDTCRNQRLKINRKINIEKNSKFEKNM